MHAMVAGIAYRQGDELKIATKSHAVTKKIGSFMPEGIAFLTLLKDTPPDVQLTIRTDNASFMSVRRAYMLIQSQPFGRT